MQGAQWRTADLDEAIRHVSNVYSHHALQMDRHARSLNMRLSSLDAAPAGSVVSLAYGADVEVDATDLPDLYLIMTCSKGDGAVMQGRSRAEWTDGVTLPVSANVATRFQFAENFEQQSFRPDAAALNALCSNWIGRPLECPLRFRLSPFSPELAAAWTHAMQLLIASRHTPRTSAMDASLSEFMLGLLLNGQPHNFSDELRRAPTSLPRAVVARAEEYIRAHCDRPLSLVEIAEAVGVSCRSLQASFKRIGSSSPLKMLRTIRLDEARAKLRKGEATVTDVALQLGFFHLGRFSAQYKQAFGELPASTLSRARRPAPKFHHDDS